MTLLRYLLGCCLLMAGSAQAQPKQMEKLDRGLVALKTDPGVFLSWRLLGTEPVDARFNIYRDGKRINRELEEARKAKPAEKESMPKLHRDPDTGTYRPS